MSAKRFFYVCTGLLVAVVLTLDSCSPSRQQQDAARQAIRVAWRAYTVELPTSDNFAVSTYDREGLLAIASLESTRSGLPPGRGPEDRYLTGTLGGLVSTLRDRHSARVGLFFNNAEVFENDETREAGLDLMKAYSVADAVAERTILRLAAWERRFLHETYLSDSYIGRLSAMVESQRVKGTPDSMLLHRPEIEARIAWADSAVATEIQRTK